MRARNVHDGVFNLESGVCSPGEVCEFNRKEFAFLTTMGRAEPVDDDQAAEEAHEEVASHGLTPAPPAPTPAPPAPTPAPAPAPAPAPVATPVAKDTKATKATKAAKAAKPTNDFT